MPTASNVVTQFSNASAPVSGSGSPCEVSFGGANVAQACSNIYLEIDLNDPTNTGTPATFQVDIKGGINSTNISIGSYTAAGLYTVTAPNPINYWQANLVSLTGGVAPTVSVRGITGE